MRHPGLLLALLAAAAAPPVLGDTVRLKSGQMIQGKVQDRGAYVIIEKDFPQAKGAAAPAGVSGTAAPAAVSATASASVRIERAEILSIEIDGQVVRPAQDLDVVVFVNGDELPGHVEIREGGKQIVVVGEGDRGEVVLDSRQVRTVLWSKRAEAEQRSGTATIGEMIQKLLDELKSPDEALRAGARDRLQQLGIYALPYLEARLEDADPAARDAIRSVVEIARLRTYMTPALAERVPGLARALVDGNEHQRIAALKEAVVASPKDLVPILVNLAKHDPSKDVRAFVLGQLTLMGRNVELLELLESNDGSLRFAAAIALGDNGVFVGIPLLIEALKHEELAIRKIAIEKLERWTGQFLGFFADAEPESRAKAVAKWEEWWAKEGPALVQRSLRSTIRKDTVSEEDKAHGIGHWLNAQSLWDEVAASGIEGEARRKELQKVRFVLEKSLECYPQDVNARIALGVLCYTELGENELAKREFDLVLHRYEEDASDTSRLHARFHLGRIAQVEGRFGEAETHYRLALSIDGKNVDVLRGLGTLAYERALKDDKLDKAGRRHWFEESVKSFGQGIAALDQYDIDLRANAERAADAIALAQPFRRGVFLKSVDAVKLELRRTAADLRYLRGRSYAALQLGKPAYEDYAAALQLDPDNPLYKSAVKAFAPGR